MCFHARHLANSSQHRHNDCGCNESAAESAVCCGADLGVKKVRVRTLAIAAIASAITVGILFALFSFVGGIGPDGPDVWGVVFLVLHAPGILVGEALDLVGATGTIVIESITFLQFLLFYAAILTLFDRWRVQDR